MTSNNFIRYIQDFITQVRSFLICESSLLMSSGNFHLYYFIPDSLLRWYMLHVDIMHVVYILHTNIVNILMLCMLNQLVSVSSASHLSQGRCRGVFTDLQSKPSKFQIAEIVVVQNNVAGQFFLLVVHVHMLITGAHKSRPTPGIMPRLSQSEINVTWKMSESFPQREENSQLINQVQIDVVTHTILALAIFCLF